MCVSQKNKIIISVFQQKTNKNFIYLNFFFVRLSLSLTHFSSSLYSTRAIITKHCVYGAEKWNVFYILKTNKNNVNGMWEQKEPFKLQQKTWEIIALVSWMEYITTDAATTTNKTDRNNNNGTRNTWESVTKPGF